MNNTMLKTKKTQYEPIPVVHHCLLFSTKEDSIHLPIGLWKDWVNARHGFPNGESSEFPSMNEKAKYVKSLLTAKTDSRERDQDNVAKEALLQLKNRGSVLLELHTGFGKTALAIYLSIRLGLKVCILCHLDKVRQQWREEFEVFSGGTVRCQMVKGSKPLDPDADVYIIGIQKASKMPRETFSSIGTLIVDEMHICTLSAFTHTVLLFNPRYFVGLTATKDRPDGFHKAFTYYFGSDKEHIKRMEHKNFTVRKVETPFKPKLDYIMVNGRMVPNWNLMVSSIEENEQRWQLILKIVKKHPEEKIIILCNRNILANGIFDLLKKEKESAALLIQGASKYDKTARVLVAGFKKGGVGLNDPELSMAIIASDTKDVRQYEGRIRQTDNLIYHLVDNHKCFENHWKPCSEWYIQKGATIETIALKKEQPSEGLVSFRLVGL